MSRKTRICFICPGATSLFFPELPPSFGGAETQFFLIARELAKRGDFDVHAAVHGEWGRPAVARHGVTVHFVPFLPGLRSKILFQRLLARIDAGVYLQRAIGSLTKEVAFFCLWRRRTFVYWIAAELDVDPSIQGTGVDRTRWFEWGMLRANMLVAQTRAQASRLKTNYGRDAVVIPNAFPPRRPPSENREHVLWVGRFIPLKQPELFVELARRLSGERFVLVAPAADNLSRDCFERLRPALESLPNLEYNPGVPLEEIQPCYDRAKLLVNTSTTEGFPNTFIQAMWAATPLASLCFDPDGIIATHELGVAPTGDFNSFAEAVRSILNDPERLGRCGANALAYAGAHHNLERNAETLARHLRNLVERPGLTDKESGAPEG